MNIFELGYVLSEFRNHARHGVTQWRNGCGPDDGDAIWAKVADALDDVAKQLMQPGPLGKVVKLARDMSGTVDLRLMPQGIEFWRFGPTDGPRIVGFIRWQDLESSKTVVELVEAAMSKTSGPDAGDALAYGVAGTFGHNDHIGGGHLAIATDFGGGGGGLHTQNGGGAGVGGGGSAEGTSPVTFGAGVSDPTSDIGGGGGSGCDMLVVHRPVPVRV